MKRCRSMTGMMTWSFILFVVFLWSGSIEISVAADSRNDSGSKHAGAQINNKQIMHQIHSAIVEDESLPYCAHMVRVYCKGGKAQLEGKVHTAQEKAKVHEKAAHIIGDRNVIDNVVVLVKNDNRQVKQEETWIRESKAPRVQTRIPNEVRGITMHVER